MAKISLELDVELVIGTNEDGLGGVSVAEETFWAGQNKVMSAVEKEGVVVSDEHIDRTFPYENAGTRKP